MQLSRRVLIIAALVATLITTVRAGEITLRSGAAQVALIELYTSEGCSSCPPAEAWLNRLKNDPGLWREFVPIALHVNYWDHLGWRDRLADAGFTARERTFAHLWGASSVYTPCFVRNGAEWRPADVKPARESSSPRDAGLLIVQWQPDGRNVRVEFAAPTNAQLRGLDFKVALLGMGIVSNVRLGENAGRELRHDFVVLRWADAKLQRTETGGWIGDAILPGAKAVASRYALAAWVARTGEITPLQAVGGWLE